MEALALFLIVLPFVLLFTWVRNIYMLSQYKGNNTDKESKGFIILRAIGVVFIPLGCLLGFL